MHFKMSSAICFNFDQFKILSSGDGLGIITDNLQFSVSHQGQGLPAIMHVIHSRGERAIEQERKINMLALRKRFLSNFLITLWKMKCL